MIVWYPLDFSVIQISIHVYLLWLNHQQHIPVFAWFLFYFLVMVAVVSFSLFQVVKFQLVISYELAILFYKN